MSKTIAISNETYSRLQEIAVPFEEKTPEDVIKRLLNKFEKSKGSVREESTNTEPVKAQAFVRKLSERHRRERGVRIMLEQTIMRAGSVPDMYKQVLIWLVDSTNYMEQLGSEIPFKTSSKRYLISDKPIHPTGKDFVKPVYFKGFYMEAHKNYENAINSLAKLLEIVGVELKYLPLRE